MIFDHFVKIKYSTVLHFCIGIEVFIAVCCILPWGWRPARTASSEMGNVFVDAQLNASCPANAVLSASSFSFDSLLSRTLCNWIEDELFNVSKLNAQYMFRSHELLAPMNCINIFSL